MTAKLTLLLLVLVAAAARPATAQRFMYSGVPDADVLSFLSKLQKAVSAGDRATVAGLVRYPLRVNRDATHHIVIATAPELLKQYDAVFTPTIRQAIITETPARLTGGKDGVAIKSGLLWLSSGCDSSQPPKCRLGVASVNVGAER